MLGLNEHFFKIFWILILGINQFVARTGSLILGGRMYKYVNTNMQRKKYFPINFENYLFAFISFTVWWVIKSSAISKAILVLFSFSWTWINLSALSLIPGEICSCWCSRPVPSFLPAPAWVPSPTSIVPIIPAPTSIVPIIPATSCRVPDLHWIPGTENCGESWRLNQACLFSLNKTNFI